MGVLVIPEGKTFLFRIAIFIGLATVVTTIIYLTPVPDEIVPIQWWGTENERRRRKVALELSVNKKNQYPQSCSRPCHELDWPMICRVKLTLERYQTLSSACKDCSTNKTACYHENCITADGRTKGILTANRQFPGPVLQVCQHDIIVVDVVNRIPGQSFGVHWRGQPQSETPYMDGVPMITQCPIPSLTTFQYKFRASESGTHLWHVNTGEEMLDTLFGPLIVRRPDSKEVHRQLYDTDDIANVVVIHTWNPQKYDLIFPDNSSPIKLLINGKTEGNGTPPSVFIVSPGKRHRFRVAYMSGTTNCQVRLSIDNHHFLVISLDGHSVKPKMVSSVRLSSGERLDFVLRSDQKISSYHMRVTPTETCNNVIPTSAIIRYQGSEKVVPTDAFNEENYSRIPETTEMKLHYDTNCSTENSGEVCLQNIHAIKPIPEELAQKPDLIFYFFHGTTAASTSNIVNTSFIALDDTVRIPQTNNLTMMLPSSPLLSQAQQIRPDDICNNETIPVRCKNSIGNICECVHVVDVPLNAVIEIVLVNQDKNDHVFHLHGYSFYVLGASKLLKENNQPEQIKLLDKTNKFIKRNFYHPVIKDTVAVVNSSAVVIRFKADNPGYWLLDEEQGSYWSRGMSLVLHVGKKSDLTPIPKNFPKCGDWIGPEFFLV